LDSALIWMNNGLAENISVYHNSIFCADAGPRTGSLLGVGKAERLNGWVFKNNLVVAAWSQPRSLAPDNPDILSKLDIVGNLLVNLTQVPDGNFVDEDPGVTRNGEKPGPFWYPVDTEAFVVDRGVELGEAFEGKAPDIGAFEFGREPWTLEGIPQPQW